MMKLLRIISCLILLSGCVDSTTTGESEPPQHTNNHPQNTNNQRNSEEVVSHVLALHMQMTPPDLQTLYTRDVRSDEFLDAQVTLGEGGPDLPVLGVRFRGASSRNYAKKSFQIRLTERPELEDFPDFNFRSDVRDAGNRILLNSMWTDPSGMREALSFQMYNELGLPAPDSYFTTLWINGVYEGLYVGLERIDREAMKRWGLHRKEGEFTLVRDQSKSNRHLAEIRDRSIFGFDIDSVLESDEARIELLQEVFDVVGEVDDHDWSGLLELIRWARRVPAGEVYATEFAERFDLDQIVDFLAIHVLTHDRDSLDIDFWLYRDDRPDADRRWKFIPWDKNLTFGAHYFNDFQGQNDFFDYDRDFLLTMGNALVTKFLQTPALRARLNVRLLELMEQFDVAYFQRQIRAHSESIRPDMLRAAGPNSFRVHPGQHHGTAGYFDEHAQSLIDFVELRYAYIRSQIEPTGSPEYERELTISDGSKGDVYFFTDSAGWVIARLELEEPVAETQIRVRVTEATIGRIDREWTVDSSHEVTGRLSLYYRNTPWENWFESLVDVGSQWDLRIHEYNADWVPLESVVNPFSNRVSAHVRLVGSKKFSLQ